MSKIQDESNKERISQVSINDRLISEGEVTHIAWLAHIQLNNSEKGVLTEQFNKILDYFGKINEVNTASVNPTFNIFDLVNVSREDTIKKSLTKTKILQSTHGKKTGFIKSPRIV